jgi:hypothetical protein
MTNNASSIKFSYSFRPDISFFFLVQTLQVGGVKFVENEQIFEKNDLKKS